MTRTKKPVGEDDLAAYVDGELTDERRAFVEDWLAARPAEQEKVRADIEIKERLVASLKPLADDSVPAHMRVERIAAVVRARQLSHLRKVAAVLALFVLGASGGWTMRGAFPPPSERTLQASASEPDRTEVGFALAAHSVFVPEKRHPVEVSAEAKDHLGTWLGNRIGNPVDIPDLSVQGLNLLGGRLLPGRGGQPAGQLMYANEKGERFTLFIQRGWGEEASFAFDQRNGFGLLAWRSPAFAYVLTGTATQDDLVRIAHAVHRGE